MSEPVPDGQLPSTHWARVVASCDRESREALAELCEAYWYPAYACVRRKIYSAADDLDLTQRYFVRLLEGDPLAAADFSKGRFRTFLLTVCGFFLADVRDDDRALKRGGGRSSIQGRSGCPSSFCRSESSAMSLAEIAPKTMTAEELMELPEDGIERDIINGELRERPMTLRNPGHSETEVNVSHLLRLWRDGQPEPRGKVVGGEAGFRLQRDPETFVGIDVAYVSAEMVAGRDRKLKFFEGPPALAVEILSPSDSHRKVVEKVNLYLEVGTVVWVVDPDFRTLSVHRPGHPVEVYNDRQEFVGDPELPGFRVAVARLFDG